MNKPQFVKTRKFVSDNRTPLAFLAGGLTSSAVTFFALGGNVTLLKLTSANSEMLKEGGAVVYELKDQTLHLINIPAVEAVQAAL